MRYKIPKKLLSEIDSVMNIQLTDPSSKRDHYMMGLANGMIMIKSIIVGEEPKFFKMDRSATTKKG